jgi:hypothetical protein
VGSEILGPLLILSNIASVLAVGVIVSHGVLVLKRSGEFWWVVVGPGWVLVSKFRSFWKFLVPSLVSGQSFWFKIARYSNEVSG